MTISLRIIFCHVSGITWIRYAHNRKSEKPYKLKLFGSTITNGPEHGSQKHIRSLMLERREL
jgi:hypothetical protein